MPAFTPNRGYPYSLPTDPADVPGALQALAEAIDDDVCELTAGVTGRPVSKFRGTGPYLSNSTSFSLAAPPFASVFRVPFDTTDFNQIPCTLQSQDVGNRLITPTVPGFYFIVGEIQVPPLTAAATVNWMSIEMRKTNSVPALGTLIAGASHSVPVDGSDRNLRLLTAGAGVFMNGTTDSFALEFRADTSPDVASYGIAERTLTIFRMTQS